MNTKSFTHLAFLSVMMANIVFAQTSYQFGVLPAVNVNKKFKEDWSLNTRIESRQLFQNGDFEGNIFGKYDYVLTDVSLLAGKKIALNSRIAGGYLLRIEDGGAAHRVSIQYVVVQRLSKFRLAHRFLSDQTFSKIESPEFRLRYRITAEIALNGESVDTKEFYMRLNNEYVNSLQESEYDLEIRLVPLLGYQINERFKIESGLDYRVNLFIHNNTRHTFWLSFNFFIDF